MELTSIIAQLKSIEAQLQVLRAQLAWLAPPKEGPTKFSDLYGLWKGKVHFTYEEIKEAEIKLPEDLE